MRLLLALLAGALLAGCGAGETTDGANLPPKRDKAAETKADK